MSEEIILISFVVFLQLLFFTKTYLHINKLSELFPSKDKLKTYRISAEEAIETLSKTHKDSTSVPEIESSEIKNIDTEEDKKLEPAVINDTEPGNETKENSKSIDYDYFLSDPDPSGFFEIQKLHTKFNSQESIFKLTVDPNDQTIGEFTVVADQTRHQELIASCESLLEPACEILGSKSGTIIISIRPGKVKLVKTEWEILEKSVISFKDTSSTDESNEISEPLKSQKDLALERAGIENQENQKLLKFEEYFLESGKKYYLQAPDPEGKFIDKDKSDDLIGKKSAFVLLIDPNNNERGFYKVIPDSKTHSFLLKNFNKYIKPTCDYDENKKGNAIITLKGGILNLHKEKWVIETKTKIIIV